MALLAGTACSGGSKSTTSTHRNSSTTRATSTSSTSTVATTSTTRAPRTPPKVATTTTTTPAQTLLQALLASGTHADIKIVYDTPSGQATLIRRNGDSVYADGTGVRFTLGNVSYDCTGTGDGATCTSIKGDATQSDVDVYTALVADALSAPSFHVTESTKSILGRTAECVLIDGRQTARAGTFVNACIDDETGVLLRFSALGPPDPGPKLYAVSLGTPTDADFQLPVAPSSGP
ncbi:MAG TPA: hypothetical protein VGI86_09990 [Acidimicrobiia bacterium]|jgi:hypothetical protein